MKTIIGSVVRLSFLLIGVISDPCFGREEEVEVIGCVIDIGKKPYGNVQIELSGVNYNGGAGYTGNNSVGTTDERGIFSVRMKAGSPRQPAVPARMGVPAQPEVPAQVARAVIRGAKTIYVFPGWGSGAFEGRDVWPAREVSNIGERVDTRKEGCFPFPYAVDVAGVHTSEGLDDLPYPSSVTLRLTSGPGEARLGSPMPTSSRPRPFNFFVDLRGRDEYEVKVVDQPKGADCQVVSGGKGKLGVTHITLAHVNGWVTDDLHVHCKKKIEPEEKKIEPEEPTTAALPRRGANGGSALFRNALENADQEERDRPAREARERSERDRIAADEARLAREQEAALAAKGNGGSDLAEAVRALGDAARAYANSKAKPAGIPACTPGAGYDAKTCRCILNPKGTGCPGAPESGGVDCWHKGPECLRKYNSR